MKNQWVTDDGPTAEICHHKCIMKMHHGGKVHGTNEMDISPVEGELNPVVPSSGRRRIWMRLLLILTMASCVGSLGCYCPGVYIALSLILTGIYGYLRLSTVLPTLSRGGKLRVALMCAVALAIFTLGAPGRLFCLFILALVAAQSTQEDKADSEAVADVVLISVFSLLYYAIVTVPLLWQGADAASHLISQAAEPVFRRPVWLGPTILGLPIILLAIISCTVDFVLSRRRSLGAYAGGLIGAAVMVLGYLGLHTWIPYAASQGSGFPNMMAGDARVWTGWLDFLYPENMPIVLLVLLCIPLLLFVQPRPLRRIRFWPAGRRAIPALAIGLMVIGVFLITHQWRIAKADKRVMIFDKGYLSFQVPDFTAFGDKSGGMFGLLPQFLTDRGWTVERAPLEKKALSRAKVLVLINMLDKFTDAEKKEIQDFVRQGGSLLILGDHTGVMGIREPFNDLLEGTGIEFNFDAARSLVEGWLDTYHYLPHPANTQRSPLAAATNECEIWVGASLSTQRPARPVLVGSYGASDIGNLASPDRGYLGNMSYDLGEKLGDVVLVAESRLGKGKVLVYADTSPFQNGALTFSHKYAERVFWHLAASGSPPSWGLIVGTLALVCGCALLFVGRAANAIWLAFAMIPLAWYLSATTSQPCPSQYKMSDSARLACIDASHVNNASMNSWVDDGLGGLVYNLLRNGISPVVLDRFTEEQLSEADFLFVIAPGKQYKRAELDVIDRFLRRGGRVIVTCGWEEKEGCEGLFRQYGISLVNVPLGRFDVPKKDSPTGEARLIVYGGWPIKTEGDDHEVWCNAWGHDVMIHKKIGEGSLVVIGDSSFLLDKNLEGTQEYFPANVIFFRDMMTKLAVQDD